MRSFRASAARMRSMEPRSYGSSKCWASLSANDSESITRSHDKLRCLQLLAASGIELPSTGFGTFEPRLVGLDRLCRAKGRWS